MELFDTKSETPVKLEPRTRPEYQNTLFDWLARRAEANIGVAQALATAENEKAEQIKQLQSTLSEQMKILQQHISANHEGELNALKSNILICTDRLNRLEHTQTIAQAAKDTLQQASDVGEQLMQRHTALERRFDTLAASHETLRADIHTLENEVRKTLAKIELVTADSRHFLSQPHSFAQRIAHSESAIKQPQALGVHNTAKSEETSKISTGDIAISKSRLTQLEDKQPKTSWPDTSSNQLVATLQEPRDPLVQMQHEELADDLSPRLLAFGVSNLGRPTTKIEKISSMVFSTPLHADLRSASDSRTDIADMSNTSPEQGSEFSLCNSTREPGLTISRTAREWRTQTAPRVSLLEAREAQRVNTKRQLVPALEAKSNESSLTDHNLPVLAVNHQALAGFQEHLQRLSQRILEHDLAIHRVRIRADASADQTAEFNARLATDFAEIKTEVIQLASQQSRFRFAQRQLHDVETTLNVKLDAVQRQLRIEHEGFDHWGKGLRQSFAAELSAVQAQMSERQTQVERRCAGLETWQNLVRDSLEKLEGRLQQHLESENSPSHQWRSVKSDLVALAERLNHLQARASQFENLAAALTQDNGYPIVEPQIDLLKILPQEHGRVDPGVERTLSDKLTELETHFTNALIRHQTNLNESINRSEEMPTQLHNELIVLKMNLPPCQSGSGLSPVVEEALAAMARAFEEKLATQLGQIETREAARSERADNMFASLQTELAGRRATPSHCEMLNNPSDSIDAQKQHFRGAERNQITDAVLIGLKAEMVTLNEKCLALDGTLALNPALDALEEKLSVSMEELRQEITERFAEFDSRETDLQDLNERPQSLMVRVAQSSAATQSSLNVVATAQPCGIDVSAAAAVPQSANGDGSPTPIQVKNEKEELLTLQDRMSAEIERVRTELKERSGRWKVRKTAF